MNIRICAEGLVYEDWDDPNHPDTPPVNGIHSDVLPNIGDRVMFYNTNGRDATWTVVGITWMISPNYPNNPDSDGLAHVCVTIRKQKP